MLNSIQKSCYLKSPHSNSLLAHTLAHIHGCGGGKITRFTLGRTDNKGGVFPVWKLPVFYGIGIAY